MFTCLLLLTLATLPGAAETWRLNPNDAPRLPSIFEKLKNGDKVVLERGTYALFRGLKLEGLHDVTIEGRGRVDLVLHTLWEPVLNVRECEMVRIRHIRARHKNPPEGYECEGAVIQFQSCNKVGVWDSRLNGCGAAGVYAVKSRDVLIKGNRIFNNSYAGVWLYESNAYVIDNKIYDNAASFMSSRDSQVIFMGNETKDNRGNEYTSAQDIERQLSE